MTEQEYLTELRLIETEKTNKIKALDLKFAIERSGVKEGSIVTDGIRSIKVQSIQLSISHSRSVVFCGAKLKKNYVEYKYGKHDYIHQSSPNFRVIKY